MIRSLDSRILCISLLNMGLCFAGVAQANAGAPQDDLKRLERELAKAGPEAADGRFAAGRALFGHKAAEAHRIVHRRLLEDDDPDGVRKVLLGLLEQGLRGGSDPVFGPGSETETHKPLELQSSYVAPLAHLLGQGPELERAARSCLLRLDDQAYFKGLEAMFADPALVAEAIRGCQESRLLITGKLLAARLADPKHGVAAQDALQVLTFEGAPFASAEAFDQWYRERRGWTYTKLAEDAARRSRGEIGQVKEAADRALLAARAELVVAMASAAAPPWDRIRLICLSEEIRGQTKHCLVALRPLLAERLHEGNAARERRAFHSALAGRLGEAAGKRALMLEVAAHLLRPDDPAEKELRDAVCVRLREALSSADVAARIGALRGLQRFPTAENRTSVIAAADVAVAELREGVAGDGARRVLTAAFSTLVGKRPVWTAPSSGAPELARLVDVVRRAFAHPGAGPAKRQALEVTRLRDSEGAGVAELFGALADLAQDTEREPELRRLAFIYLRDAASDASFAQRYVMVAIQLLGDGQVSLRRLAADRLKQVDDLPVASEGLRDRAKAVFDAVRARLTVETSPEVYGRLVATFGKVASPPLGDANSATNAIQALVTAVQDTTKEPVRPEVQFRLEPLLTELAVIASDFGEQPAQWIPATETLVSLDQRVQAQAVLAKRRPSQLAKDSAEEGLVKRGWLLPLLTASLKAPAEDLGADEAAEVLACMGHLGADGDAGWLDAERRVLRIEAWSAVGDHKNVLAEGPKLLGDDAVVPVEARDRVRYRLAAAHVATGAFAASTPLLEAVALDGPLAGAAAVLADNAAAQLVGKPEAVAAANALMKLTPPTDPQYRARVLLWAEVRTKANPEDAEVATTLEAHKGLFEAGDCPDDLKKRFAALSRKGTEESSFRVGGGH